MAKIKNRCKREISKRYDIVHKFENKLKTRAWTNDIIQTIIHQIFIKGKIGYLYSAKKLQFLFLYDRTIRK